MRSAVMMMLLVVAGCAGSGGTQPAQPPTVGVGSAAGAPGEAPAAGEEAPAAPGEAPECRHPEPIGPVIVSDPIYAMRTGYNAVRFSQLNTSQKRPLEECGLRSVLQRLATLTCDDGSNPFSGDLRAAHASRAGNLGPGGRCNSILDQYDVPCRDKTYAVHADMYFCTQANAQNWLD